MQSEDTLNQGDAVEVTYDKKIIGYVFSFNENELVLCASNEVSSENQLFTVKAGNIRSVMHLQRPIYTAEDSPRVGADQGKVLRPRFGKKDPQVIA